MAFERRPQLHWWRWGITLCLGALVWWRQKKSKRMAISSFLQVGGFETTATAARGAQALTSASSDAVVAQDEEEKTHDYFDSASTDSIRRWGCYRTETPLIFVHVGKAGGGTVRARLAGSAKNYTRDVWRWRYAKQDKSYYPVQRRRQLTDNGNNETVLHRGRFCNERFQFAKFEPDFCHAVTPLGQAIGCPDLAHACGSPPTEHVVFTGHNLFGHELHWLPVPYLQQWWAEHWAVASNDDRFAPLWQTLDGNQSWWCGDQRRPLGNQRMPNLLPRVGEHLWTQTPCARELQHNADAWALQHMTDRRGLAMQTPLQRAKVWSDVYASLPVLRVTVAREPFSWFVSKFYWHWTHENYTVSCTNLSHAVYGSGDDDILKGLNYDLARKQRSLIDGQGPGWARRFALHHIYLWCGTDCMYRHYQQQATLEEIEAQAAHNLRQGFAVIGLSEDIPTFFQMLSARVDYLNTTLNPLVMGDSHASYGLGQPECRAHFAQPSFQQAMMEQSPEVAALVRLHKLAVQVHQVQKQELQQQCASRWKEYEFIMNRTAPTAAEISAVRRAKQEAQRAARRPQHK